ncbi:hypothetical protein GCK32_013891 [Trichostrongylus colubriformis]|uniref:Uncharacterized protein n=1 Tax=Trichostrongylus colubriformis TaxID=6319 RepID=A0AAN8FNI8_TRICO
MLPLFLIGIIAAICSAGGLPEGVVGLEENGHYGLAADFSLPSSFIGPPVFSCLKKAGFSIVFLPIYNAHVHPHWISDAFFNIPAAIRAGLGVEVYMVPKYHAFKEEQGLVQMNEAAGVFTNTPLKTRRIWIKVKTQNFDDDTRYNKEFLTEMISTAQKLNIDVGIYTNRKQWDFITGEWNLGGHKLWYWNVTDVGRGGETPANFENFRSFGGWTEPTVKQFGKREKICGVMVNWDVYDVRRLKHYETQKV